METRIIKEPITKEELRVIAEKQFGDFVKAAVDIERGVMALGGEWHVHARDVLIRQGSKEDDIWGINLHPDGNQEEFIEFNSAINIRPPQGNLSRSVENKDIQQKIRSIVGKFIKE